MRVRQVRDNDRSLSYAFRAVFRCFVGGANHSNTDRTLLYELLRDLKAPLSRAPQACMSLPVARRKNSDPF